MQESLGFSSLPEQDCASHLKQGFACWSWASVWLCDRLVFRWLCQSEQVEGGEVGKGSLWAVAGPSEHLL